MRIDRVRTILKVGVMALGLSHSSPAVAKIAEKAQFATKPIEQKFIARSNTTTALVNNAADKFEHVQIAQNRSSGAKRVASPTKPAATHKKTQSKLKVPSFSNTKLIGESKKSWIYEFTNYSNFTQSDTTEFERVTLAASKKNPDNRISRCDFKPVVKRGRYLIFNDSTRTLYLDGKGGFVTVDEVRKSNKYSVTIQNDAGVVLKNTYTKNKDTGAIENLERTVVFPGTNEELIIEKDFEYNAIYKGILGPYKDLLDLKAPVNKVQDAEEKAASKGPKFGLG